MNEPISDEWEFTLSLSTTNVGALSQTFAENFGSLGGEEVFSGTVQLQTDGVPRGPGLPHEFDYVVEFDSAFPYFPAQGDLLVDVVFEVPLDDPWIWVDADIRTGEYVEAKPFGPLATKVGRGLFVTQFTVIAEPLQAGDADQDFDFDQVDVVQVLNAAKYLTGEVATWGEGDWNGAPGGSVGIPPAGDNLFNQMDIIAANLAGTYLQGPYAALQADGETGDAQASLVYNASTGQLSVGAPAGKELTSINVASASGKFLGERPAALDGAFDNFAADNLFKATFGGSFGPISFGNVLPVGIAESDLAADLSVVGSLAGGHDLSDFDLVYVPEPATALILVVGLVACLLPFRKT